MREQEQARSAAGTTRGERRPGDAEVQSFLERYARALTAGKARELANMWGVPALVVSDEGIHGVSSLEEVERFFAAAYEHYAARGVVATRPELQRLEWLSSRVALAEVRWPSLDREGRVVGVEWSTYTLRREESGLRIHVVMVHAPPPPSAAARA